MGAEVARTALQTLADEKLKDAQILLAAKSWSNAYYLAGYAIELALKACIAKTFKAETIPDKDLVLATYRHKFRELVGTAGLSAELQKQRAGRTKLRRKLGRCELVVAGCPICEFD